MYEMLDYSELNKSVNKSVNKVAATDENKKRFVKIAFDVFMKEDAEEELWILHKDADTGEEFFVRNFEENPLKKEASQKTNWAAHPDKEKNITVFYKSTPICKFNKKIWGYEEDEARTFCKALVSQASESSAFVSCILKSAGESKQDIIFSQHPELKELME